MSDVNYNDGSVHGWNGGDMPIHPKTRVTYWTDSVIGASALAGTLNWKPSWLNKNTVRAFRVIKPYIEPRVIWVNEYEDAASATVIGHAHVSEVSARQMAGLDCTRVAVRYVEVLE